MDVEALRLWHCRDHPRRHDALDRVITRELPERLSRATGLLARGSVGMGTRARIPHVSLLVRDTGAVCPDDLFICIFLGPDSLHACTLHGLHRLRARVGPQWRDEAARAVARARSSVPSPIRSRLRDQPPDWVGPRYRPVHALGREIAYGPETGSRLLEVLSLLKPVILEQSPRNSPPS